MKVTARRVKNFTHRVSMRDHEVVVDEPVADGGDDEGPAPQELLAGSLASCTAITVEMYAKRKGWDIGQIAVDCEYELGEPGSPTEINVTVWLPDGLSDDQIERLTKIAAKCPVHRTLEGEIRIVDRVAITARP
jgi:putative redox protein